MLRFRFLGYPVTIQPIFWLLSFLIGMSFAGNGEPARLIIAIACIMGSILVHEIGHGTLYRYFGAAPSITLHGMGGLCHGHGYQPGANWRGKQILISLAGPVFGLLLYLLAAFLLKTFPDLNPNLSFALRVLAWINLFWNLLNLLPVIPMDGGRIFEAILGHGDWQRKVLAGVGILVSLAACIYGFMNGQIFLAMIFGMMLMDNFKTIKI